MISKNEAIEIIKNSKDIINVKFVKKDCTVRSMNCRSSVKSHLTPKSEKVRKDVEDHQHITVFDMNWVGYRKINIDTIISIKKKGVVYLVNN